MRAWEYEHLRFVDARPDPEGSVEGWGKAVDAARDQDEQIRKAWLSTVPESGAPTCLMIAAIGALENRGYRVRNWEEPALRALESSHAGDMDGLIRSHVQVQKAISEAEPDPESEYWNYKWYASFDEFLRNSPVERYVSQRGCDKEACRKKIRGCWIGQAVGGALGTPIEGYSRTALRERYGDITGYVKTPDPMNDDLTYQIAFLRSVSRHGLAVTAGAIALEWAALIPYGWSAEAVALENILNGILPPDSATRRNPFSDWIGAQMRGAAPGLAAPGNSREAARLAWLDGSVSHAGNGILGEVFNAVMTSRAFVENDPRRIIVDSVEMIPSDSEYGEVVRFALLCCRNETGPDAALALCGERYKKYHWVHSYPNVCIEIIALWFGIGDFDETARIVASAGYDVDCNAAQSLGMLGVVNTDSGIPERWIEPLGGRVETYCRGIPYISFDDLTELVVSAVRACGAC